MGKRVRFCLAMVVVAVAVFVGLAVAESRSPRLEAVDGVCVVDAIPPEPALLSGWQEVDGGFELDLRLGDDCDELYVLRPGQMRAVFLADGVDSLELQDVGTSMFRIQGRGTAHRLMILPEGRATTYTSNTSVFVGSAAALVEQRNGAVLLRFFIMGLEFAALLFTFCLWLRKRSETYLLAFGAYTVFTLLHITQQAFRAAVGSVLPIATLWGVVGSLGAGWFSSLWSKAVEFGLLFFVLREFVPVQFGRVNYLWGCLVVWIACMVTATCTSDPVVRQMALAFFYPAASVITYIVLFRAALLSGSREHLALLFAWSLAIPILVFNWAREIGPFGMYSLGARVGLVGIAGSILLMGMAFVICTKFSDKFAEAEVLSAELERVNTGLEETVAQRTAELQKSYDSLKEEQRRRDEFISNVAHNIKTPLFSVSGYCEMAASCIDADPAQAASFIETARGNADQAQATVKDLLLATRLENRRLQFLPVRVDIRVVTQRVAASVLPQAQLAGVSVERTPCPDVPLFCQADSTYIGNAIENIVVNAVESCHDGGHVLIEELEEADEVLVRISDDGCGICEEAIGHIFERYWSSKHGHRSGTGIGLSIAKDIVEQNGGSIEVRSTVEVGTVFTVKLPVYHE